MRERKTFGQRSRASNGRQVRRKFFLLYEGTETEVQYFDAVRRSCAELGINALIDLCPIEKQISEMTHSSPVRMIQDLNQKLANQERGFVSCRAIIDKVCDLVRSSDDEVDNQQLTRIMQHLKAFCKEKGWDYEASFSLSESQEKVKGIVGRLLEDHAELNEIVALVPAVLEKPSIVYDKDIDKICIIADRDSHCFHTEQYEAVVSECERQGYKLYISNPCFEFWLLMHFDDMGEIDQQKMLENKRIGSSKHSARYAVSLLNTKMKAISEEAGYQKNRINTDFFIPLIPIALKNSKNWAQDVKELESRLGSGVSKLFEEIL